MHKDEEKFFEVLKSFVEIFKIDGPLVKRREELSIKEQSTINDRISLAMKDFSPGDKAAILHGIMVYLLMLVNDYDAQYDSDSMPTACVIAESMFAGIQEIIAKELFINCSRAVVHALENPITFRKGIQSEDPTMFEILMTADCANSSKGD
jgi:hypothetical protein